MTTIKSAMFTSERTLEITDHGGGDTNLTIHSGTFKGDLGITVKGADLRAALDSIPKHVGASWALFDAMKARAEAAEAERDALATTIERVRALKWVGTYNAPYLKEKLAAALDPKPDPEPFVLPTEVPARIVVVKSSTGDEKELTLFTDGDTTWWADIEDWGPFWTRSQVMDQFTGHRLLDGAE